MRIYSKPSNFTPAPPYFTPNRHFIWSSSIHVKTQVAGFCERSQTDFNIWGNPWMAVAKHTNIQKQHLITITIIIIPRWQVLTNGALRSPKVCSVHQIWILHHRHPDLSIIIVLCCKIWYWIEMKTNPHRGHRLNPHRELEAEEEDGDEWKRCLVGFFARFGAGVKWRKRREVMAMVTWC